MGELTTRLETASLETSELHGVMAQLHGQLSSMQSDLDDAKEREGEVTRQRRDMYVDRAQHITIALFLHCRHDAVDSGCCGSRRRRRCCSKGTVRRCRYRTGFSTSSGGCLT